MELKRNDRQYWQAVVTVLKSSKYFSREFDRHQCILPFTDCVLALMQSKDTEIAFEHLLALFNIEALSVADALVVFLRKAVEHEDFEGTSGIAKQCRLNVFETIKCNCGKKLECKWNDGDFIQPVWMPITVNGVLGFEDIIKEQFKNVLGFCPVSAKCIEKKSVRSLRFVHSPLLQFFELIWQKFDLDLAKAFLNHLDRELRYPLENLRYLCIGIIFVKGQDVVYTGRVQNEWFLNGKLFAKNTSELSKLLGDQEVPKILIYEKTFESESFWVCECQQQISSTEKYCEACSKLAPGLTGWLCNCKRLCTQEELTCLNCQSPRFKINYWNCIKCRDFNNLSSTFCQACTYPKNPVEIIQIPTSIWKCRVCKELNLPNTPCKNCEKTLSKKCFLCKAPCLQEICLSHSCCLFCYKSTKIMHCGTCLQEVSNCKCNEPRYLICGSCIGEFWKCPDCKQLNGNYQCSKCSYIFVKECVSCNCEIRSHSFCNKCLIEVKRRCGQCLRSEFLCGVCARGRG